MSKIAIISDSHDNLPNIKKFLDYCKGEKIKFIMHCGDIASLETWNYFQDNFKGEIHAVKGNADQIKLDRKKTFEIDKIKIGMAHRIDTAQRLVLKDLDMHYAFYGHSHKPWIEKMYYTFIVNPGNLSGMFYKATFAVLDTETNNLELKILENV
ncbi:MAG TPA: metallophosphoesterase [Candidatus Bipolaricaulota bacterium]|nr:metallophosphoesterase [Candidatus Bipolaricaulota bacterium]